MDDVSEPSINAGPIKHGLNVVVEDDDSSIGNIFCFGAFADKQTGILYNNLNGSFPYISLEGNVCFLVIYHYESNVILALPLSGFDDNTIFAAYITQFEFLESKCHKIKLNVMDNQCTKQIKKNPHCKQLQPPVGQASHPLCEPGRMRNPDVQGSLYQCPCDG